MITVNNSYIEQSLPKFVNVAKRYILEAQIQDFVEPWDLVNQSYLNLINGSFNNIDHFCGSFFKSMKTQCFTVYRQARRNVSVDFNNFRLNENEELFEGNKEIPNWVIAAAIEEETHEKHKKALLCIAEGHTYDEIAEMLNVTRRNVRFYVFEAKKKLIERLRLRGYEVENSKNVPSKVNIEYLVQTAEMYDDFPFSEKSYRRLIFFLLEKNTVLTKRKAVCLLAKNKGMLYASCRNPFQAAVDKMIAEGIVEIDTITFEYRLK